jgi:hypothetical protein
MRRGESVGDIIRGGKKKAYLLILLGFRIWHLKDARRTYMRRWSRLKPTKYLSHIAIVPLSFPVVFSSCPVL